LPSTCACTCRRRGSLPKRQRARLLVNPRRHSGISRYLFRHDQRRYAAELSRDVDAYSRDLAYRICLSPRHGERGDFPNVPSSLCVSLRQANLYQVTNLLPSLAATGREPALHWLRPHR
jgi:hypothetical protein